jgi:neurofibromin 1
VTENEAALFRSNSTLTRMMSAFARIHGYTYLRSLIQPLVHNMADLPPGQGYELDPSKVGHQAVKQNQRNVEFITTSFLEILYASISTLPSLVLCDFSHASMLMTAQNVPRNLCIYVQVCVGFFSLVSYSLLVVPSSQYFPDAKFAALGAFIFLR